MIKQEEFEYMGKHFIKTYSDEGKYIIQEQTGNKYGEAVDILGKYTYIESDELIQNEEDMQEGRSISHPIDQDNIQEQKGE